MENDWISIAMEEYKTLRTESLESMKGQQATLKVGTATVGVLAASAFSLWDKTLLPDFIFMVFLPVICYLILVIWIGEVQRMMRAGKFISTIEKKINDNFILKDNNVLSWENWLRIESAKGNTNQMKLNYFAILALFLFVSLISIGIGDYRIFYKIPFWWLLIINVVEIVIFTITFFYLMRTGKKLEKS